MIRIVGVKNGKAAEAFFSSRRKAAAEARGYKAPVFETGRFVEVTSGDLPFRVWEGYKLFGSLKEVPKK